MAERYLVIVRRPYGPGLRTTVAVFADANQASGEMARVQDQVGKSGGWVELASVDDGGRLTPLFRFGGPPGAADASHESARHGAVPARSHGPAADRAAMRPTPRPSAAQAGP